MLVFGAVIVVEVEGADAGFEEFEGFGGGVSGGEVGVAEVERDAYVGEVAGGEDFEEVFGGGDFVLKIFEEDFYAEGVGEGLEVFDGGERVFEGAEVPGIVLEAEVEGESSEGDLLGAVEGALDLVHGDDAVGFFGVDEIDVRSDVAGPLAGSAVAQGDGLMEGGSCTGVAEPGSDVADSRAIGVIEVMTGGEDLNDRAAVWGETAQDRIEEAGVQALLQEDVG